MASPELASTLDLRPRELLVAGVLGLLVLIGGLFPQWVQGSRRVPAALGWRGWRQDNRRKGSAATAGYNAHEFKPPQ